MNKKLFILALGAAMTAVSCQEGNKNVIDPEVDLIGDITEDRILEEGQTYTLTGGLHVKEGATLTIEPGVTIIAQDDDQVDYILIEQGAMIDARGTAGAPIVMTSSRKEAGAWGGLHICGKAPINAGTDAKSEIGDASYGGDDASDNSGILQYVRVEYGGYAFSEEKEANGFTFYGVGNGTTVDHLQAYGGSDDGFEWFGGTVNVKYLISTNNTDDSFDWTEGWTGKGQFMIAQQISDECDALIEADNNDNDNMAEPISHPVLSNLTLVGNGADGRGVRLRAGTQAEIYNAIVTGKGRALTTETEGTESALADGTSKLQYIYLSSGVSSDNEEGSVLYDQNDFLANDNHNAVGYAAELTNSIMGTIDGGLDASGIDSFFDNAAYAGALPSSNDWTSGWALSADGGSTGSETVELEGYITEDMTLKAGVNYILIGGLHVKEGATLTIEPGTVITAQDDNSVDYILIEQGAMIDARGTAENPIVMTAERKEAGAWGGLHICGKAPINAGTGAKSEVGDASYGGDDAHDNSGTLQYVRIEYGGYAFSEEKEANGFTFYGVGDGTTVDHLQAYNGSDDGFEWFGGTVNVKYLVSTNNTDDSFDWTEGWSGKGQFMVAYQTSAECDALMECDNNDNDNMADPISHPVLSNLTLVGNNGENERGIRLRAGTQAEIYNAIVTGKGRALTTETEGTESALADGTSKLQYVYLSSGVSSDSDNVLYTQDMFLAEDNHNQVNYTFSLTDNFVGTIDGGLDASSIDSFFESAAFIGAISVDNNWMAGWTL